MKQVIIYTRFSPRPNAKDCDSCEQQEKRCREYCEQLSYTVHAVYYEKNMSGGSLDRPKLRGIMKDLYSGDIIIVDSSDRLARDMLVNLTIRHQVEQAGATIEFADGSPQDTTPEGKLFQNILAAFAAYERDRIRLRTKQGLAKKKAAGQWLGKPPVGYRVDPETKRLVKDEYEQIVIDYIRLSGKAGWASEDIVGQLDIRYPDFRGKPWSARTVRKILKKAREKS